MPAKVVLKQIKGGFKNISPVKAAEMEKENRAYRPSPKSAPGIYFEKAPETIPIPQEPEEKEDPPSKPQVRDQTYQTRTMEAEKPVSSRRRSHRKVGTPKED